MEVTLSCAQGNYINELSRIFKHGNQKTNSSVKYSYLLTQIRPPFLVSITIYYVIRPIDCFGPDTSKVMLNNIKMSC